MVGGGDYGAASVDATRPKPSIRGPEAIVATNSRIHGDKALVLYSTMASLAEREYAGTPKERWTMESLVGQQARIDGEMHDQDMQERTNTMEAVGQGAADELTGPWSSVGSNEYPELELPRRWEPWDTS